MKVITEEMLHEKFAALYWGTDNCDQLLEKLLAECKEIGTLTDNKPEEPTKEMIWPDACG